MSIRSRLARHVVDPLTLWHRGELATYRHGREFARSQWLPADALRELQAARLRRLLRHAFGRCPFYRRRFDAAGLHPEDVAGPEDLRLLPPLEKADVQRHAGDMVAAGWPAGDLIANRSGGSTGTPVRFFSCRDRKCSRQAAARRHNRWAGWEVGDSEAVIWGAPRDKPSASWKARLAGRLRDPLWLDAARIDDAALTAFRDGLRRHRPRVVLAYAGAATLFARYVLTAGAELPPPRAVVTSAETLSADDRCLIEAAFAAPVFDRYGCREVGVIASQCERRGGLHVMAEGLIVEVVTAAGPAGVGEPGAVLVTDLMNFAMPLIRYRLGDVAEWADGACECGRPLPRLRRVVGRVSDFLVGADGRLVSGAVVATHVVATRPSLGRVQIVQEAPGEVTYRVVPGPGFDPSRDLAFLEAETRRYLGPGAAAAFEVRDSLPAEASGKFLVSRSSAAAFG